MRNPLESPQLREGGVGIVHEKICVGMSATLSQSNMHSRAASSAKSCTFQLSNSLLASTSPVFCGSNFRSRVSNIKSAIMKNSRVGSSVAGSANLHGSARGRLLVLTARRGTVNPALGDAPCVPTGRYAWYEEVDGGRSGLELSMSAGNSATNAVGEACGATFCEVGVGGWCCCGCCCCGCG